MRGPVGCVAAVTYRCNSRCGMCDIWKQPAHAEREMAPADYRWLPRSLLSVNLSGGEPFLRDDLPEIAAEVARACPRARIVVSTNGLMPERTEETMRSMLGVAVRVSVDAVGPLHDRLRGVPGAFDKAMETVDRLRRIGVADLGLAATSSENNPGELERVRALADEKGIAFVASAVHSSPIFFGAHAGERPHSAAAVEEMSELLKRDLASRRPRDWAMAYYMRGLIDYVKGRPRRLPCGAGRYFFFIDPWGDVYPCNIQGARMGNIRDGSFGELQRRTASTVGAAVSACTEQCWMVCTVSPPMRMRPWRPLAWMAGAKLFGLDTGAPDRRS